MKQIIEKYSCDNCKDEMHSWEYMNAVKLSLSIALPNPKGGSGQASHIKMVICEKCTKELGIVNSNEYHGYDYSQSRLSNTFDKIKGKILDMCFKKKEVQDDRR